MTKFQEKIKLIIKGKYELSDDDKYVVERYWSSNYNFDEDLKKASKGKRMYARKKERMENDDLYKRWCIILNRLYVTLHNLKKGKIKSTDSVKRYIQELKSIEDEGFDPSQLRNSKIDWDKTFAVGDEIIYKSDDDASEEMLRSRKYYNQRCVYEGKEYTLGQLRYIFEKSGEESKRASDFIVK